MDGSAARVERIFEQHGNSLLRYLRVRLGNPEDAADLAQDAYVRLLRIASWPANPRAFLFRVAANLVVDRARAETRQARAQQQLALTPGEEPCATASPEMEIQVSERLEETAAALNELPRACQRAFILHRFRGRSHAQIAEDLGVSRSMVEKHLIRALRHLQRRLL